MLCRDVRDIDLEACFAVEPSHLGAELVGRQKALAAWRWMLNSPSFGGAAVEAERPDSRRPVVAFGASAFVRSSFANDEIENPRPGVNARIIASIADGDPVLLDYEQLREGNTHARLQLAVLSAWVKTPDADEMGQAAALLSVGKDRRLIGYRIFRVFYEAIGKDEVAIHESTGISRFVRKYGVDRGLLTITRESAFGVAENSVSALFVDRLPVLCLSEADQRLLCAAVDGLTDEELVQQLNVHVGTVKKRWSTIFDRIAEMRPDILSDFHAGSDEATRGKQKRHRVLAHIREHPEELRPFDYKSGGQQNRSSIVS